METFADVIVSMRLAGPAEVGEALRELGDRATARLDSLDTERRVVLIGQFVRNLRSVPLEHANLAEQKLPARLTQGPPAARELALGDSLALITLRNAVRLSLVYAGVNLAASMRLQSAAANIARVITQHGARRVHLTHDSHELRLTFDAGRGEALAGVLKGAEDAGFRLGGSSTTTELRFAFAAQAA